MDYGRQWDLRSQGATLPLYSIDAHPTTRLRLLGQARSAACAVPSQAALSCHGYITYRSAVLVRPRHMDAVGGVNTFLCGLTSSC